MSEEDKGRHSERLHRLIDVCLHGRHSRWVDQIAPLLPAQQQRAVISEDVVAANPGEEGPRLRYDELREAICVIRDFAAQNHFLVYDPSSGSIEPYIDMANSCRNAMVKILKCERTDVHFALKYCAKGRGRGGRRYQLWTFARSNEHGGRSLILGPKKRIAVYKNSAFASIVGCKDSKKNVWPARPNQCFSCNDLTELPNYADSKKNWRNHYRALLAFPLRYVEDNNGESKDRVIGFLTFDSPVLGVFGDIPSRFSYMDRSEEYLTEFRRTDVYHVGYALADALALATLMAGRIVGKDTGIPIEGDR